MEVIIALLTRQGQLEKKHFSLREIARTADLDYTSTLFREKEWLLDRRILVCGEDMHTYTINYNNICYWLFYAYNTKVLHSFAFQYLIPNKELE